MSNIRTYRVNHAMQMISIPLHSTTNSYHLGNNRMVMHEYYGAEQMNNYYPYGGLMSSSTGWNVQRFKYNGKEFDRMHGLDWYDYGARWMDASIGRWHSMDPLCEKYYSVSPYVYCMNNPVMLVDPDGKEILDMLPAQTLTHAMGKHNFFNRWHDNSNSIILMGHGGDNGKSFCTVNDPIVDKIFANSSYGMEYFLEDNTKTWNFGSIASEKVELVLFSCETGSDDGLAENLSKQDGFQDISIFAPSESVCIHPDGSVSIDNHGVWREYRNGEVVNEYSGNTVPGTQEFNSSNFWEKTPQFWQK